MRKVKLKTFYEAKHSLKKIFCADLPVAIAFQINRCTSQIEEVINQIESQRITLVMKYGSMSAENKVEVAQGTEAYEKFEKEFLELLDVEVDVLFSKIPINPSEVSLKLSAKDLQLLSEILIDWKD